MNLGGHSVHGSIAPVREDKGASTKPSLGTAGGAALDTETEAVSADPTR